MNIYLCSTVRHLLFSLLKALSEPEKNSRIFMICDQQNIDKDNFDMACLPENVEVIFIERKQIRKDLYSGLKGKIIKLMANFNVTTTEATRKKIGDLLFNETLHSPMTHEQLALGKLFVFNDRNKMSRLFRLAFKQYSLIEEGWANYFGIKLKKIEKLQKLITQSNRGMRYFGDDSRCQSIFLNNPELAPSAIQNKVSVINFINQTSITNYCHPFFKIKKIQKCTTIIATQPIQSTIGGNVAMTIYKKLIFKLTQKGIPIFLKPHPREDIDTYRTALPNVTIIDNKVPLELIACGTSEKCNVISIYSTAGVGFEKYYNRMNLILDHEQEPEQLKRILKHWNDNPSDIDERIRQLLSISK